MFDLRKAQRAKNNLDRNYRSKAAALRKANDQAQYEILISEWHFEGKEAEDVINALVTRSLVAKANKLDLPIPPYPKHNEQENAYWYYSDDGSERILTAQGRAELRDSVRREKRERFESRSRWVTLFTGIIGAAIGLVTVITNLIGRVWRH
jgi:hypothetical protein